MSKATTAPCVFSDLLVDALVKLYGTSSTAELAQKCGVTPSKMTGYLTGDFTPSLGTLARMCKGLSNHRLAMLVRAAEEPPEPLVSEGRSLFDRAKGCTAVLDAIAEGRLRYPK